MTPGTLREIHVETVLIPLQANIFSAGQRLQIAPFQRLTRIVARFGDVGLEETRLMGCRRIKNTLIGAGIHFGGRPIGASQIESTVFGPSGTGQLAIGNLLTVIVVWHLTIDLMPIVEGLCARHSYGRLGGIRFRSLRIFQKNLIGPTHGISHGTMTKNQRQTHGVDKSNTKDRRQCFHSAGIFHQEIFGFTPDPTKRPKKTMKGLCGAKSGALRAFPKEKTVSYRRRTSSLRASGLPDF